MEQEILKPTYEKPVLSKEGQLVDISASVATFGIKQNNSQKSLGFLRSFFHIPPRLIKKRLDNGRNQKRNL
jgi:hypothetical protein